MRGIGAFDLEPRVKYLYFRKYWKMLFLKVLHFHKLLFVPLLQTGAYKKFGKEKQQLWSYIPWFNEKVCNVTTLSSDRIRQTSVLVFVTYFIFVWLITNTSILYLVFHYFYISHVINMNLKWRKIKKSFTMRYKNK